MVQWLQFHAPNARGPGSIPGQGTRPYMSQLRLCMTQLNIVHAATKNPMCRARFGSTYTKIGTIQRLAWSMRKDDTQIREAFHIFL